MMRSLGAMDAGLLVLHPRCQKLEVGMLESRQTIQGMSSPSRRGASSALWRALSRALSTDHTIERGHSDARSFR